MQSSLKATAPGVLTTMPVKIAFISWTGAGSAGDSLVVVDGNGRDICRLTANGVDYDLSVSFGERTFDVLGINVTAITSGTVTFYYR